MDLILASSSQRRQELLKLITDEFEIITSDFDESSISFNGNCNSYVIDISKGKAMDVCNKISEESIIIASDTIVYFNGEILLKPKDEEDAFNMIKKLSGKVHEVYSGIVVLNSKTKEIKTDAVCTKVKFSNLTDVEIQKYIDTKEPMDKAGAYGIQGKAAIFVEEIKGDYYSVVGLPLNRLNIALKEMGVNL